MHDKNTTTPTNIGVKPNVGRGNKKVKIDPFIEWEIKIEKGNQFFADNDFGEAKEEYLCAKELAHQIFESMVSPDSAVPALVVSYHNVADLYKKERKFNQAYQELDEINSYLVSCLEKVGKNSKRSNAIRRGIDMTHAELLSFIQKNKIEITYGNVINTKKHNN